MLAAFDKMQAAEALDAEAIRAAALRQQAAEAHALRELAEMHCPQDLIDWGKRHGIPMFAEMTWEAGFAQGWKMGLARAARKEREADHG